MRTGKYFFYKKSTVYSAPDRGAEHCDERVCLCVCVRVCLFMRVRIFGNTRPIFTNFYPRESFREGLWNHRRTFVCLSVCLLPR